MHREPDETPILRFYQITLFYNNLKDNQSAVRDIHKIIDDISSGKFRVLSSGAQVCAIGFETVLDHDRIKQCFKDQGTNDFHYILIEVSSIVCGYLPNGIWEWIEKRPTTRR